MAPAISDSLKLKIDKILAEWEHRAQAKLESAAGVTPLLMKDHFPVFLNQLADALARVIMKPSLPVVQDREQALLFVKQHGQSRASLGYTLAEVIRELQIMRQVVLEVMEEDGPLAVPDRNLILEEFDETLNDASVQFAAMQSELHDQFTIMLVHDLRSPLNVVKMNAHLIKQDPAASAQSSHAAEKIDKHMDRFEFMLKQILDVSRIRAGLRLSVEFEEFRLDLLAREVVQEINETYQQSVELHADEPIIGMWNRDGLRRVLENLIINALKYGTPNTPVSVVLTQSATHAMFRVHNEGNPITAEDQPKLFKKFLRAATATTKTGWGLGLALVSGMVTAHNGTVRIESSEASGTDFIIELPKHGS